MTECECRTVRFPLLTDDQHSIIIEALAYYHQRTFVVREREIEDLQDHIRENVKHAPFDDFPPGPDHRNIDDISAVDECDSCDWTPAAIILVDGSWQCYNCGLDPGES